MHDKINNAAALKRKTISSLYWVFGTSLPAQLISWGITIFLARMLSPNDYGLLGMAMLICGFLSLFNDLGLGPAVIQKKDLSRDELDSCFWLGCAIGVLLFGLSYISAPLVAAFFAEPRLKNMIRLVSLTFILGGLYTIPYNLLYRNLLFDRRGITDFLSRISNGGLALVLAFNGFGVWSLIYGMIFGEAIKLICSFVFMPWLPHVKCSYILVREMMAFGYNVAAERALWYFYSRSDVLIAGKFLGKTLLGFYSMAFQLASMPLDKVVVLVNQVAFPMFSKIQEDDDLLKKFFLKLTRSTAFVTFPLFCGMAAVSDTAIPLFLSDKWVPMLFVFNILCYASGFRALSILTGPLVLSKGRPDIGLQNILLCTILMPASFFVGSLYGLKGLSLGWLTVYPVLFLIMLKRSIRLIGLPLREYVSSLFHPILGTAFMFFVVAGSDRFLVGMDSMGLRLMSLCTLGAASYLAFILFFAKDFLPDIKSLFKK